MKIEIGKEYHISPRHKKSYVTRETFKDNHSEGVVVVEATWRSGSFIVKVTNQDELEALTEYMADDAEGDMEPIEFEENEFVDSLDQCGVNYYIRLEESNDEVEATITECCDEEGISYLFDNGYETVDCEHYFGLPLDVEEVTEDNRYAHTARENNED